MRAIVRLLVLACLLVGVCRAQDVYNEINVGTPPNGLFHGGEVDTVQMGNGNLHIEIPLWSVKGRGPLAAGAIFVLDTKEWTAKFTTNKQTGDVTATIRPELQGTLGGIVSGLNTLRVSSTTHAGTTACWSGYGYVSDYVFREPNGTKHHLVPDPGDGCPPVQHWSQYYADDGSGFAFFYGPKTYAKDGVLFGSTVIDTNGNEIVSGQDTLGRSLVDGSLTYFDDAGNAQAIQITYTSVKMNTNLCPLYVIAK